MKTGRHLLINTLLVLCVALQHLLMHGKGIFQQVMFLFLVVGLETRSYTGTGVPPCIHHVAAIVMLCLVQQCLYPGLHERPCTSIEWLFLTPHNVLCVRIGIEVLLQLLPREGIQLLNARDGGILDALAFPMLDQSSVDLARADNDTVDLVVRIDRLVLVSRIWDDPLEVAVSRKVFNVGAC